MKQRIKSICLIKRENEILFSVGSDPKRNITFLIPIGGGVEFQELASTAAVREVNEELGVEIQNPILIEIFENIFCWNGIEGHEIIFCFLAEVEDKNLVPQYGIESNGHNFELRWLDRNAIERLDIPIYPDGLTDILIRNDKIWENA